MKPPLPFVDELWNAPESEVAEFGSLECRSELLPPFPRTRCTENGSLGAAWGVLPMTVEMSPSWSLRLREPELLVQGHGHRARVWLRGHGLGLGWGGRCVPPGADLWGLTEMPNSFRDS